LTSESLVDSPRIEWLKTHRIFHLVFFILGVVGSAIFFVYLLPHWWWLAVSAVITFLYSAPKIPHPYFRALRKVAIGKTIFLSLLIFAFCTFPLYYYGFSVLSVMLLLIPGIIAAAVYNYAKKNFSDYLYYLMLDGLMMFSALLMLVLRI